MGKPVDAVSISSRRSSFAVTGLYIVLAVALGHALLNHLSHASDYILEQYGFRQTQTAITTYWFLRDGFRFAYLTPVFGSPWSVPFEFPLFQLLAAYAVKLTGASIDTAGRSVSFIFFLASLWPIFLIGRWMKMPRTFFPIAGILYCCSPLYLFWGRTFMIESLALFLALWFLALAVRVLSADQMPAPGLAAVLCLAGILAALVKVTTVGTTFLLVSVLVAFDVLRKWRLEQRLNIAALSRSPVLPVLGALFVATVSFTLWDRFADAVKAASPLTVWLESAHLTRWNFGTMHDRIGPELWLMVARRAIPESIGAGGTLVLGAVFAMRFTQRQWIAVMAFVALFLLPFLIFPTLHIIHSYYQYANAVYLLLAAAVVLSALAEERPVWAAALVLAVAALQLGGFERGYAMAEGSIRDPTDSRPLELALTLKSRIGPDAAFLGLGLDWSSEVPYYSERRSLLIDDRVTDEQRTAIAANPAAFLGGVPLEAVVSCPKVAMSPVALAAISELTKGSRKEVVAGCDVYSGIRAQLPAMLGTRVGNEGQR